MTNKKRTVAVPKALNQHLRTRKDHSSETAEDYVEAILKIIDDKGECRVKDLSSKFLVSHVTVNKILSRLNREELVVTQPYGPVLLTLTGKKLAAESQTRHETVVKFLIAIGVKPTTAENDAEGIEHHVSDETLRCMKKYIFD